MREVKDLEGYRDGIGITITHFCSVGLQIINVLHVAAGDHIPAGCVYLTKNGHDIV